MILLFRDFNGDHLSTRPDSFCDGFICHRKLKNVARYSVNTFVKSDSVKLPILKLILLSQNRRELNNLQNWPLSPCHGKAKSIIAS